MAVPGIRQQHSLPIQVDDLSGVQDSLLLLDERDAVNEGLDTLNRRRLRQLLWLLTVIMSIYCLVLLAGARFLALLPALTVLVSNVVLLRHQRAAEYLHRNVRLVGTSVLIVHLLLLQLIHQGATLGNGVLVWFFLFPLMATRFRFRAGELLALYGSLYALLTARVMVELLLSSEINKIDIIEVTVLLSLFLVVVFLPMLGLAWGLTQRLERRFVIRWRAEAVRHRDRLRMKQELEYARQIQLNMLPKHAPDLDWLDVAALSLPANEVGGDYYDYFRLDDDRLVVVVGDVTGHGVASGLVLSGVRSSLNLLQEELAEPKKILSRVNTMLKRTTARRMLMTLGVAVLDRREQSLVVATAGHPPVLLLRSGTRHAIEVGAGAFPLGAMTRTEYQETKLPLAPGDVLLIYSDGLVETPNHQHEQYGWDRLHDLLADLSGSESAKEIRDIILRDVWSYKGETTQVDDVTMVVIRLGDAFAA